MNKDEMLKDVENAVGVAGFFKPQYQSKELTDYLWGKNYRKVAEDEIIITKSEYEQLKKYNRDRKRLRLRWQQTKQEVKDTEKKTKQETARKILQDMCKIAGGTQWNLVGLSEIKAYAKRKYGIELE